MIKQVIIIRKDLKMRRGKEIAQGAHASMKWLADRIRGQSDLRLNKDEEEWLLGGKFTKICLQVNSCEELMAIHDAAKEAGLTTSLIEDSGATEFNGVPTITSMAVGPNESEEIDKITGHLSLY